MMTLFYAQWLVVIDQFKVTDSAKLNFNVRGLSRYSFLLLKERMYQIDVVNDEGSLYAAVVMSWFALYVIDTNFLLKR